MINLIQKFSLILTTLLLSLNSSAQNVATVGSSASSVPCDYDNIQAAIDANEDEIRVINSQTFTQQVDIGAHSVIIKGAYNSCLDAENDIQSSDLTKINGETFTAAAFSINSSDTPTAVTIDGFDISQISDNGVDEFFGSAIMINNTVGIVKLKNLYVHHNLDAYDGGISINNENISASLNVDMTDVISAYNKSYSGAGLNCRSNGLTQLNIDGQSGFSFNQTDSHGGGIYVGRCNLAFEVSQDSPLESTLIGINNNEIIESSGSGDSGGGIAVFGESHVILKGHVNVPFKINNNKGKDGGGIRANTGGDNSETLVELTYSQMINNQAYHRYGGAVYAQYGAKVVFKGGDDCLGKDLCHFFDGNTADDNGGAFYVENGATVEVNKAEVTRSRSGFSGAVGAVRNDHSNLTINNSLLHHNGDEDHTEFYDWYLIKSLFGDNSININYSTVVDNSVQYAVIAPFNSIGSDVLVGNLSLIGTIVAADVSAIDNVNAPDNWSPSSVVYCVMFSQVSTNPDNFQLYEQVIIDEPMFVDPANGNYHLNVADTSAIDRCDETTYPATDSDVDGQLRPYDELSIINDLGTLDIGYDEVNFDLIFKTGFE